MCGIAGILKYDLPVDKQEIENMTNILSHRGPDGRGIWINKNVGLGHRRLSIIDLAKGTQPMSNEDNTIWITFNGEIYNFRELRKGLESRGHFFKTYSDTEVIIHSYEEWDDACVEHFRGMFAFGIADLKKHKIFLARDQIGIKPLYYLASDSCFAFASEIQAIRSMPDVKFELDLHAIDQYLMLQYIPAPRSVFKQIKKLLPAHRMSIRFDGKISGPEEYWQIRFEPIYGRSEADWLESFEYTIKDSVRAHLVADVPFGAFLSGGVDSSTVVAYMSEIMGKPIKTFSIGFEEEEFNELKYAKIVADRWKTEHHVESVKPDALEILPKIVKYYGEPFGDSSALPTYYVSKMARQFVPMVLSGDAGDELFAGYDTYLAWMKWLKLDYKVPWKKILYPVAQKILHRRYPPRVPSLDNWLRFINYMPFSLRYSLWREEYREVCKLPLDYFEEEFDRTKYFGVVNKVQYMDWKTYLPFDILTKVDIASMMYGLEVRTPFADVKVFEFAATIPEDLNIAKNNNREWEGKRLLKKMMQKYYPMEFLYRPKKGFAIPIQKWFAADGSLRDVIEERLLGSNSYLTHLFRPAVIHKIVKKNITGQVWLLLFLDEWLNQNR